MMTVSQELLALYGRYSDWIHGNVKFTVADALEFQRQFRGIIAKVGLLELGIDTHRIDVMVQAAAPGSNVVMFNTAKLHLIAARQPDGDAS
jgi:phage-related holin